MSKIKTQLIGWRYTYESIILAAITVLPYSVRFLENFIGLVYIAKIILADSNCITFTGAEQTPFFIIVAGTYGNSSAIAVFLGNNINYTTGCFRTVKYRLSTTNNFDFFNGLYRNTLHAIVVHHVNRSTINHYQGTLIKTTQNSSSRAAAKFTAARAISIVGKTNLTLDNFVSSFSTAVFDFFGIDNTDSSRNF